MFVHWYFLWSAVLQKRNSSKGLECREKDLEKKITEVELKPNC